MEKQSMMERYVAEVSHQMQMDMPGVSLIDGSSLGCKEINMVYVSSRGHRVGALTFQADLEAFVNGGASAHLELEIRLALSRLQKTVEQQAHL